MKITDKEFERLYRFMHDNYGINLIKKRTLIEGRLGGVVERRFNSFDEYIDFVLKDKTGEEISFLVSRLTTNYTYFMREKQHYTFLEQNILPKLEATLRDKDIRIWSAGCSTGEEAYTTAMVMAEYFGISSSKWDKTILATDISANVLRTAKKAVYETESLKQLPEKWKTTYFKKLNEDFYEIKDDFKGQVVFNSFNLMEQHFPFKKKFHVIFCRNVMIYFDNATREQLTRKYFDALAPGGYLFIGLSETLSNLKTPFTYVKPAIYRKG